MRNICVICDSEIDYACGFMDYINRRKTLPFDGVACTSKDSLFAYARKHPIDILLVAESLMEEDIGNIPAVLTIVLNEGLGSEPCRTYIQVYKYQACDSLLREVMEVFSTTEHAAMDFKGGKRRGTEVIGVYSPGGGSTSLAFALALGQLTAEKKKVLFADLTPFSGTNMIFDIDSERDLSDLLYFREYGGGDLGIKLSAMVSERLGMDMIPPVRSPEDLFRIPSEKWLGLFGEIAEKGSYDCVLLNIGIPSFSLLDCCSRIYIPEEDEEIAGIRTICFLEALSKSRFREAEGKIERVPVGIPDDNILEMLKENAVYGNLGKIVRGIVRGRDRFE